MNWSQATDGDRQLRKVLSYIYKNDEKLLHLLLHPDRPELIRPDLTVKKTCSGLSTGEKVLLRIGLDIWNESGGIHFNELYQELDQPVLNRVILTLLYLNSPSNESARLF